MKKRFQQRFQRLFRNSQKQVEGFGAQAEQGIEELLFSRFSRLSKVRRFVFSWILLMVLLIGGLFTQNLTLSNYFQTIRTVPGGVYNEGVLGSFTNASPLYATSNADATVSRLVFSGLLSNDQNGNLAGDLAKGYDVDAKGLTYTIHLKPQLSWHDGQPLTSADVAFTYKLIQNPDAQSPLQSSWSDIAIATPDAQTVTFTLASPLASFPYNLTNGIVPQHVLEKVPASDLRSTDFNTVHPVGSGPFAWQGIQVGGSSGANAREQIALTPFANYTGGKPKLDELIVHAYASQDELTKAFTSGQLTAVQGLTDTPAKLKTNTAVQQHSLPLKAATMVFFKTTSGVLADTSVRNALVQSADVPEITQHLEYPARLVQEPLLRGQLAFDPTLLQARFDVAAAKKMLDAAGWTTGAGGIRYKDKKPLMFSLSAADTPEYRMVTNQLKQQWQAAGVRVTVQMLGPTDLQTALTYHSYDSLLYGISIGNDPDVFVYWDSSQADVRSANRLNLSEYKNKTADAALESGRTRLDPALRTLKYKPFLEEWQKDSPALGLYQPRMLYLTRGAINGLNDVSITTATDRFSNVQNWEIRQAKVTN